MATRCHQLQIEAELVAHELWFNAPAELAGATVDDAIEVVAESPCRLRLRLRPGFLRIVDREDNEGERELMRHVIRGLCDVEARGRDGGGEQRLLTDDAIAAAVEAHAPLGPRKVIVLIDTSADPTLDNRGLPGARFVQGHDEAEAMDALGDYLIDVLGWPVGPIAPERRTEVLNAAVAFHLRQLEEIVATLSPEALLEWLVVANEALTVDFNRMRFEIPTKEACYGDVGDIREQLAERLPKSSTANVGNRFLIEYIAARPPSGTRPMSQALYDQLLGIAAQLHNRGYLSDLIHFGLEDPPLSILPSRRLGVGRDTRFGRAATRTCSISPAARSPGARTASRVCGGVRNRPNLPTSAITTRRSMTSSV